MKKSIIFSLLFASFVWAQLLPPPSNAERVTADTLSDTSLFLVQVPAYGPGMSVKMRGITLDQLEAAIGATDTAFVDSGYVQEYVDSAVRSGTWDADFDSVFARALATFRLDFQNAAIYESDAGVITTLADLAVFTDDVQIEGGVGFYGGAPAAQCSLSYSSPPNPVTDAANWAAYSVELENCLNQNGVNLIFKPE